MTCQERLYLRGVEFFEAGWLENWTTGYGNKMDGCKINFLLGWPISEGLLLLVSRRVP